jgi:hypothetical protein
MESMFVMRTVRYRGRRKRQGVEVVKQEASGAEVPLPLRLDLRNHSPAGFEWGYLGSGPAQLALALLADVVGEEWAEARHQEFKLEVVSHFPHRGWELAREDIAAWWARHGADDAE